MIYNLSVTRTRVLRVSCAQKLFGKEVAPVVVDVVDKVTEAARGMYEFDALWTANHSRFPILEYLDSHLCGPYRQMKRMAGMMGMALPLDMYELERAAEIRANPQTRMVFNQVPITLVHCDVNARLIIIFMRYYLLKEVVSMKARNQVKLKPKERKSNHIRAYLAHGKHPGYL